MPETILERGFGDGSVRMVPGIRGGVLALAIALGGHVQAAEPVLQFESESQREFYGELLEEYRCLKCQNQNLADSNAGLAGDLRREIREQVLAGKARSEIDSYLVDRYGEFVLYRPRLNSRTWFLWAGPFALLLVVATSLLFAYRRRHGLGKPVDGRPGSGVTGASDSDTAGGERPGVQQTSEGQPGEEGAAVVADSGSESDRLARARRLLEGR